MSNGKRLVGYIFLTVINFFTVEFQQYSPESCEATEMDLGAIWEPRVVCLPIDLLPILFLTYAFILWSLTSPLPF